MISRRHGWKRLVSTLLERNGGSKKRRRNPLAVRRTIEVIEQRLLSATDFVINEFWPIRMPLVVMQTVTERSILAGRIC
ncbi:MAG: hypothetical protein R3C19_12365 [Planctomycetaceae bacterium]